MPSNRTHIARVSLCIVNLLLRRGDIRGGRFPIMPPPRVLS